MNIFLFQFLILFNFLVNLIYSYYTFPFKNYRPDLSELYKFHENIPKEEVFLNYTNALSIYTLIKINDTNTYEMFFKSIKKCTFLTNNSCLTNLNEFQKPTHKNENITKIFNILLSSNNILPNKCIRGEIGLALPGYSSKTTCLPIINEIKECDNTIKSQVWSIKYYNSKQKNEYDGEFIIGIEPHDYEPDIYKEDDYFTIYNYINPDYYNEDGWILDYVGYSLYFEKVYFYNSSDNIIEIMTSDGKEAALEFDLGMIKCPFIYFILIKLHFFDEYINENICSELIFSDNYHTFICEKNKLNIKLEEFYKLFPSIYFFSYNLNYTFSLDGKDLFLEKDDKLYFMIFSRNENINNWRFGTIFLKKYYFTFNQESKRIGFYIKNSRKSEEGDESNENSENNKKKRKINYNLIILIIGIVLLVLEVGFCIYCCYKKGFIFNRRKRANELEDDSYDYQINN